MYNRLLSSIFIFVLISAVFLNLNITKVRAESCFAQITNTDSATTSCVVVEDNCSPGRKAVGSISNSLSCSCNCTENTTTPYVSPTIENKASGGSLITAKPRSISYAGDSDGPCAVDGIDLFGDDECSLKTWAGTLLRYLIGFGFVYAVVMTPYIFYLFSKNGPNDIKKAWDLIKSILYGLALLVFVATIVMLIGGNILQI